MYEVYGMCARAHVAVRARAPRAAVYIRYAQRDRDAVTAAALADPHVGRSRDGD